uniref:Polymerase beta nucleotidyltransferase domain-containing protein n=1 Tax=Chlorobium chlorochromatii (strain CaD3) TaxID=340177 RepID=Q3AQT4_CHLCH
MRLSPIAIQQIKEQVNRFFGQQAVIWLFGSRLDDNKRGGDIDLYVQTEQFNLLDELRCKVALQEQLDIPIDLIVRSKNDTSVITTHAIKNGVPL